MNTCGLPACASPCHLPVVGAGPYCAPFRCYCGGCPGHVPVDRGQPRVVLPPPPLAPPVEARPMDRAQLDRIRQAASAASAPAPGS